MKRFLKNTSLLLVISMLFAFASCKPEETEEPTTTEVTETESTASTTEEATSEAEKDTIIVSLGIEFDFIPYKYKENEKLSGINIDLMNAVADKLGMRVEFKEIAPYSSHYDPQNFDVYINQTNSDTLEVENALFSKIYMTDTQSVIVKATTDYAVYDDFYSEFDAEGYPVGVKAGIKIGVKKSTTGDIFASAPLKEWGFGQENVKEFTTNEKMINALKNEEVTAVIIDDAVARKIIDSVSGLKILESSFYSADYQVAVVSDDSEKQTKILNAINELISDGTAKKIVDKYMEY
ncbi:MAG: transporter substrate-binding domain-containing protein [Ruminococcaceae bacterium]|nr:transporter substrate-binding domain-containing protein [Oscillospiraceae bacterium]